MQKEIHREVVIKASIEKVWAAITEQESLANWYMKTDDFKPEVGCKFLFSDKPQGKWDGKIHGEVLEVDPPKRLVYTFWGNQMKNHTTVQFTLIEENQQTRLIVDHTGFEGFGDWLIGNLIAYGWKKYFKQLVQYCE